MYTHIYTITTSEKELQIWWYEIQEESIELFQDFERIFQKYKKFGCITTYTGDILEISDTKAFEEQLILMGVSIPAETTFLTLQDNTQLILNYGTTKLIEQFNELYCICFQEYDTLYTFSSETPKMLNEKDEKEVKEIIRIPIMYTNIFTPKIRLDYIAYSSLELNTSNVILNKWFSYFNQGNKLCYIQICSILEKLYQKQISNNQESEKQENKSEEKSENKVWVEEKSENKVWVEEFCNLYAEKNEKMDTLLSDIYQQYITASSWTKTETISMPQFIKYIKEIQRFTIKRKSKGMVVTGYKFLISYQEEIYNKTKAGQLYERNLLRYFNDNDIKYIKSSIESIQSLQLDIKDNYYLEAIVLLYKTGYKISKTLLDQFVNNPYIAKSLPLYSKYIKEILENPISNKCMDIYREISNKGVFFLPFTNKCYKSNDNMFKFLEQDKDASIRYYDPLEPRYNSLLETNEESENIKNIISGFKLC
jgi:hypothetical protein